MAPAPPLVPSGFFVLRTPLLPVEHLLEWVAPPGPLAAQRGHLRERLNAMLQLPEVREALFLASPSLSESLPVWQEHPDSERGQKVERALVRYFSRMSSRCTPFGLFAGMSLGAPGIEPTTLELAGRSDYRRRARLDMYLLTALADALAAEPETLRRLTYQVNTSLYRSGGALRFVEVRLANGERTYHLVRIRCTDLLDTVVERARAGAAFDALVGAVVERDPEVSRTDATGFIETLIQAQVLVSQVAPPVTGGEPLAAVLDSLAANDLATAPLAAVREVHHRLTALDASPLTSSEAPYAELTQRLQGLPVAMDTARCFQVELVKPAVQCRLGPHFLEDLINAVQVLARSQAPPPDPLRAFKDAFAARYEEREVPLSEALDPEGGIGFGNTAHDDAPFLREIRFPDPAPEPPRWTDRERFVAQRLDALGRAHEWHLNDEDLAVLSSGRQGDLPDALCALVAVESASASAPHDGRHRFSLLDCVGPSGVEPFGRFCLGNPDLHRHVLAHLRREEAFHPEALYVELAHLPAGRHGNVLLRPVLREHELPYLARSGAPADRQLTLADVRVCVRGDRVLLRSERLGRELVIRHSHMHSPDRGLGLYRFLVAVARQDASCPPWRWGPLLTRRFLPRVSHGRAIFSLAQWRLENADLKRLDAPHPDARFTQLQDLRSELGLPRWFNLVDMDQLLLVDAANALSAESFIHLARTSPSVLVREAFPEPGHSACRGPEGTFQNELLVPLVRRQARPRPTHHQGAGIAGTRAFLPGGNWLYHKLYCGPLAANDVVTEVVAEVANEAVKDGIADRWFFIRYVDPEWHVRFRLRGDPRGLWEKVALSLRRRVQPFVEDGRVWKVQLETYAPELERYGGAEGLDLAEQLFTADSEAAVAVLRACEEGDDPELAARVALRGMDLFLEGLGYEVPARLAIVERERAARLEELRAGDTLERQLAARFREERSGLEAPLPAPALAALEQRTRQAQPLLARLKECALQGRLAQPLESVAASLLHMQANRFLSAAISRQELVIYDMLARIYRSRLARELG